MKKDQISIEEVDQKLCDHIDSDRRVVDAISGDIKSIKENHLAHIEKSVNGIENSLIAVDINQKWLLKFFWIIVGGVLTSTISAAGALVIVIIKTFAK